MAESKFHDENSTGAIFARPGEASACEYCQRPDQYHPGAYKIDTSLP